MHYKWTKDVSTTIAQEYLWWDHKINKNHPEEPENKDGLQSYRSYMNPTQLVFQKDWSYTIFEFV